MIAVQEAFHELLHRNAAVHALVGERITPHRAAQHDASNEPTAFVVYHLISKVIERHIRGPVPLAQSRIQADLCAKTYAVVQELAEAVKDATDGFRGTVATSDGALRLRSVRIDSWEESHEVGNTASETGWHRVSMDFVIWHEHAIPLFAQ